MPTKQPQTNNSNITILSLVQQGATFSEIAKHLNISKGSLTPRLKKLEAQDLITRKRAGTILILALTNNGVHILNNPTPSYRIHSLWLTLPLRSPVGNDTTALLLSKGIKPRAVALKHHTDSYWVQDGYEARLNPQSLELHLPDLDRLPLEADLRQKTLDMLQKAETAIIKIEHRLGISVKRIDKDTMLARITQLHIALRDHKFAEEVNERGEKLYVYVAGELRCIVDKSHGLNEYEAVHRTFAIDDGQKLGKLTKAVITDKFDYEKNNQLLNQLVEISKINTEQIGQLAEQLNVHAPYLVAWKKVADATDNPAKRARALKVINDMRQRKLLSD